MKNTPVRTIECDLCNRTFPMRDRYVNLLQRPSDPSELCATLWVCPECGEKSSGFHSPSQVAEISSEIDKGAYTIGRHTILFLSV